MQVLRREDTISTWVKSYGGLISTSFCSCTLKVLANELFTILILKQKSTFWRSSLHSSLSLKYNAFGTKLPHCPVPSRALRCTDFVHDPSIPLWGQEAGRRQGREASQYS